MTRQMQPARRQPIGFWSARVGSAIRTRTRSRLAEVGVSQPEWWLLHQLSLHDGGIGVDEVITIIGPNDTDQAIRDAIVDARSKGWIHDDGRLTLTESGAERFRHAAEVQGELEIERRKGISDADYETTIRVLQRTARNVGSDAWHW
ncbi:MarR family winged helix-turn-helix transcriptional regulator [Gordonia sp. NPDC003504]